MINPKAELLKWGPIDGLPCYADDYIEPMMGYRTLFPPGWPDIINYYRQGKVICISDYAALRRNGAELFRKHIMKEEERKKWYDHWLGIVKQLTDRMEQLNGIELGKPGNEEVRRLFEEFLSIYRDFWTYGFLPELANWGGEQLLKEALVKEHPKHLLLLLERLSAPEELSFFQQEELELLKIAKVGNDRKRLAEHQQKYFWLGNSYGHTQVLDIKFFQDRIKEIPPEKIPGQIEEIGEFAVRTKEEKQRVIDEFKVSPGIAGIGRNLGFCIWWQDQRKRYIFMANHYITLFLRDFSQRFSIPLEELGYYSPRDLLNLVREGKKVDGRQRAEGFLEYYHETGSIESRVGEEANRFISPYLEVEVPQGLSEIKGLPVSRGRVRGMVRIVHSPKEIGKIKEGEILVAPMTSPDFIVAMRKAVGIVTDEGGITSHAAIVSRELGIPCIVGTRIATKVLRNGDFIEVNGNHGLVKIIKREKK